MHESCPINFCHCLNVVVLLQLYRNPMSMSGTLNASQSFSNSQNAKLSKAQVNFFNKIDALSAQLKEVSVKLHDLEQQATNIKEEKINVDKYLEKKSQQNRLRLMGELELFENEVKRRIEDARRETMKIDERIEKLKESQLFSLQMILSIQRRVHELEVQLGLEQQQ